VIEVFARSPGNARGGWSRGAVSGTDSNVLITGESGSGKAVVASFIHAKSFVWLYFTLTRLQPGERALGFGNRWKRFLRTSQAEHPAEAG
jgi:hypothetical protein